MGVVKVLQPAIEALDLKRLQHSVHRSKLIVGQIEKILRFIRSERVEILADHFFILL
jgi:hypothetical protein